MGFAALLYQATDLIGFAAIHSVLIIQKICYNGEYPQTMEVQTSKLLRRSLNL